MEAVCVRAQLRLRDGQTRTFSIRTGTGLSDLREGISELNRKASQTLNELVESERARAGGEGGDEDGEEEADEEDEEVNSDLHPVSKRPRSS